MPDDRRSAWEMHNEQLMARALVIEDAKAARRAVIAAEKAAAKRSQVWPARADASPLRELVTAYREEMGIFDTVKSWFRNIF